MPGVIGYLGANSLKDIHHECFSEVTGTQVTSFSNGDYQLMLKAIGNEIGVETHQNEDASVYIYGDIYSIKGIDLSVKSASEVIIESYHNGNLASIAVQLNGYFVCVIADHKNKKLVLLNDRYGLKPLYLWADHSSIKAFASEIKALVLHPAFEVSLDEEALKTFVNVGHFLAQQTMFTDVKRMLPASICNIDLTTGSFQEEFYWTWSDIDENKNVTFDQAVELSYQLFDQAMLRQLSVVSEKKLAITLSGGLDSRVLLSAAKQHFSGDICTFTFGGKDCDDAVLAKEVASHADVSNQFIEVNQENWFQGRQSGVWVTDGLKNILHMHALSSVSEITKSSHFLLNGFLGDVTFGGSYLFDSQESNLSLGEKAEIKYREYAKNAGTSLAYFNSTLNDPLFIYNRGVRFISAGSDLIGHDLHNLKPFFDNDLMEFLYSLPEEYRRNGKLYHHMLLRHYPDYFKTIPWQQTGKPISEANTGIQHTEPNWPQKFKQMLIKWVTGSPFDALLRKVYRKLVKGSHYVKYDDWLRAPEFREYVYGVLCVEHSNVQKVFSAPTVKGWVDDYYSGKAGARPELIGSLLTIELYFQRLAHFGKPIP